MSGLCLVVDDESSIRTLLRLVLEPTGFSVLEAPDASRALSLVTERHQSLDLVISDIYMPGEMNGLELAQAIQRIDGRIPVVLMTGFTNLDLGTPKTEGFRVLEKPFHPAAILAEVERLGFGASGRTSAASS